MAEDLDAETVQGASARPSITNFTPTVTEIPDTTVRRWVSYLLLALLAAVIVAGFTDLFVINGEPLAKGGKPEDIGPAADAARLMAMMNVVFGPVVTLFSSVVGFYFGARTAKEGGAG